MEDNQLVSNVINKVVKEWYQEYYITLVNEARKLPRNTGESAESIDKEIHLASANEVAKVIYQLNYNLRYFDMRNLSWGRVANVDALKRFVEKKGPEKFLPVFKAKHGFTPRSQKDLINRLAWGIAISFHKRGKWTAKRKKWYNRKKMGSLNVLIRNLIDALSKESLDQLKKALQDGR